METSKLYVLVEYRYGTSLVSFTKPGYTSGRSIISQQCEGRSSRITTAGHTGWYNTRLLDKHISQKVKHFASQRRGKEAALLFF